MVEFSQSDPFERGLGIFDMTEMTWSSSYDANAAKYQTPDVIKSSIAANGSTPTSWDDEALAQIFTPTKESTSDATQSSTPSSSTTATTSPTPKPVSSMSAGAIAGIVIGAIAGLVILALLAWFLIRRRGRNSQAQKEKEPDHSTSPPEMDGQGTAHEADSRSYMNELPSQQQDPFELGGDHQRGTKTEGGGLQATELPAEVPS
ncbi:hypothetical protein LTR36_007814 [Oleoguttula mirabilis]|uniref:Mid2 domain-containing protein n=1 Tax=Oleoguttula mirabilis TaxID=1507867 RepID=A0AAV9J9K6_9PEZI|nr:hypothetical protein LTR36_007814 [Oleoguttula mirabilis]